jgi:hypothetical protein
MKHVEIDKTDIEIIHHLIIVVATTIKIREFDKVGSTTINILVATTMSDSGLGF